MFRSVIAADKALSEMFILRNIHDLARSRIENLNCLNEEKIILIPKVQWTHGILLNTIYPALVPTHLLVR